MSDDVLKEIRTDVKELVKQGAVHNEILRQHEARSTNLEHRLKPIEDSYIFMAKAAGTLSAIGVFVGILVGIAKLLNVSMPGS